MSNSSYNPYNPLDIASIADTVVRELLARPCGPLPPTERFFGAGIYALYYHGEFPEYAPLARQNQSDCVAPIYVGKAVPQGGRKGIAVSAGSSSQALIGRLTEHAESIRAADSTLRLEDFRCRYLVVEELFIELAERKLIQRYKPVWNAALGGFGNHDPGSGRYNQKRSGWDEVHPGRPWAVNLQAGKSTADQFRAEIRQYFAKLQAQPSMEVTVLDEGEGELPEDGS
jgi:hypothetical protein